LAVRPPSSADPLAVWKRIFLQALFDQSIISLFKINQLRWRQLWLFTTYLVNAFLDFQQQIEQTLFPRLGIAFNEEEQFTQMVGVAQSMQHKILEVGFPTIVHGTTCRLGDAMRLGFLTPLADRHSTLAGRSCRVEPVQLSINVGPDSSNAQFFLLGQVFLDGFVD
jgi:hypothetical protein